MYVHSSPRGGTNSEHKTSPRCSRSNSCPARRLIHLSLSLIQPLAHLHGGSTTACILKVNAIGDTLFGTRFDLKDGTVRGPWCPGGGTAGPLLLQLARHRRFPRLALFLFSLSRRITWVSQLLFARSRQRWIPFRRPSSSSFRGHATALEVLEVIKQADGSLSVALPRSIAAEEEKSAGAYRVAEVNLAGYEY